MTDRPIIFSSPMVRALIDGRKTQTRRVLKEQPPSWATVCQQPSMLNALHEWVPSGLWTWSEDEQDPPRALRRWPVDAEGEHYWLRPRYCVGDRLWVRETWRIPAMDDFFSPHDIAGHALEAGYASPWAATVYEADGARVNWEPMYGEPGRKRAAMHMPRWASRLTLTVTDVRVQRLQEISEEDARAEGVELGDQNATSSNNVFAYQCIWDHLNAKRSGCTWSDDPWVVAISFTVEHRNIDALEVAA